MGWSTLVRRIDWPEAAVQLVLVIVGILTALAIDDWRQDRENRQAEITALRGIRAGLAADVVGLSGDLEFQRQGLAGARLLLRPDVVRALPRDSLDVLYGDVLHSTLFIANRAAYETLKSRGLELVENDSLRLAIASLYEQRYSNVEKLERVDVEQWGSALRPYYLEHFRSIDVFNSATPIDYAGVAADPHFRAVLSWTASWRRLTISVIQNTLEDARALTGAIDREVKRLE